VRKRYHLENLHCPNCAAKIEKVLSQTEGVKRVKLNFTLSTLDVEIDQEVDVEKIIRTVEGDVRIVQHEDKRRHFEMLSLLVALALLVLSFAFHWWYLSLLSYILAGYDVFLKAFRNLKKGFVLDENFLMSVATIGAIFLKQYEEAAAVMVLYKIGELLQDMAVNRSRKSVKTLIENMPKQAWLVQDNHLVQVDPKDIEIGQIVLVKTGEKVPVDGIILEGSTVLDTSSLTGESVPRYAATSDAIPAGVIVKGSPVKIRASKKFEDSSMANILKLVENASERKAKSERFITTFARYYTPIVVSLAFLVSLIIPFLTRQSLSTWVNRGLILLVISCPCALVLAVPLAYFAAIGRLSKDGVLVKGSTFIDTLAAVKNVVFDKTGTLTEGDFQIANVENSDGYSKEEILMYSAHAEINSNHPIAKSIVKACQKIDHSILKDFEEINGLGVRCSVNGRMVHVGNDRFLHLEQIPHPESVCSLDADSVTHVAIDKEYAGNIQLAERLRNTSELTVRTLRENGIEVHMLTGDNEQKASRISEKLHGINYHAQLLAQDKLAILENQIMRTGKTAYVGDGINDTPALARADVGVAMNGLGNDAAIQIADVVVMSSEPIKIAESIEVSKFTRKVVIQNMVFAIAMKAFFITLAIAGKATMWQGVFADTGVALLCTLNSTRVLFSKRKVG